MAQIINNPDIPHLSPINNGLSPGKMIRIQGATAPTAQRFNINLQCGPNLSPRDDLALHLSVRIIEGCIARNTLDKQMWGDEQTQGYNPIAPGQQFEILILSDQSSYKIAINGQHFCEFSYRLPVNRVSHLTIDGDVSIRLISHEVGAAPTPSAPQQMGGPDQGYGGPPMYGPPQGAPMYGPPGGPPQGAPIYGPPGGPPGPYGGPGPYGPPPPPGHNPDGEKSGSGLEGFLGQAGAAIAGAFGSAVLQGALSGKQNQPAPNQQPQAPPQQQSPQQPFAGGYGGQSVGGLGSIGSFLTSTLANTVLKPSKKD